MLEVGIFPLLEVSLAVSPLVFLLVMFSKRLSCYRAGTRQLLWLVLAVRLALPFNMGEGLFQIVVPASQPVMDLYSPEQIAEIQGYKEWALERMEAGIEPVREEPIPAHPVTSAPTLREVLTAIWLVGAAGVFVYHMASYRHGLQRLRRWQSAVPAADRALFDALKSGLKIRRSVTLVRSGAASTPMLIGFLRSAVVLPDRDIPAGELAAVLRHELTHHRRGDLWFKLLLVIVSALHWFNPLVHLMARQADVAMEKACDSHVLWDADPGNRKQYGLAVLHSLEGAMSRTTALSTCFAGRKGQLKERFMEIIDTAKKKHGRALLAGLLACTVLCGGLVAVAAGAANISRTVPMRPYSVGKLERLPRYDRNESFSVDLRGGDLTGLDLTKSEGTLRFADFDSNTKWPKKLPTGFDPTKILENGKDSGLGVRSLQERGITGKGISIGIIDQVLPTGHVEYKNRIKHYEEIGISYTGASMHGPAVASLAVGKNTGVAPDANLYFIASELINAENKISYLNYAKSIDRLLEINKGLSKQDKIRCIVIARGWVEEDEGYAEVKAAIQRAKDADVFIISTSLDQDYKLYGTQFEDLNVGFDFAGADRLPTEDPNKPASYSVGSFHKPGANSASNSWLKNCVFFPMDNRTYASFTGESDYAFSAEGGWSWVVPYIGGLYAMACQVEPDITPQQFWSLVRTTATRQTVDNLGTPFTMLLANPVALIEAIEAM